MPPTCAYHGLRIGEQIAQRFVERRVAVVLAHDPGRGLAQLDQGAGGKLGHLRIPARGRWIAAGHALSDLHQRMLGVPGLGAVGQILADFGVGQLAAEPGHVPEEKREEHQQQREDRDQEVGALAGHWNHYCCTSNLISASAPNFRNVL